MAEKENLITSLTGIFNKLTVVQRLIIGGILLVTLIMIGTLLFIFDEPDYSVLYTNLQPDDASKVVDYLNGQKIKYSIDNEGRTIKVPNEKVYDTRIKLAAQGVPGSGIVGYEIFDQSSMGMSEFQQRLNYKRALEGELARTIMQVEGVEGARVQIVLPEKTVFKDEQKEPSASIVLRINPRFSLSNQNILAIANLLSSSVEGLKPGKVVILDTQGRLLSKDVEDNSFGASSNKQLEIKRRIEEYYALKAQNSLNLVLGEGNSIVQVTADLDFDQIEKTMTLFDPESQIEISEQVDRSTLNETDAGDSKGQTNEKTTTNYEISKTIQRVIESPGKVKRLSVAAIINQSLKEVKEDKVTRYFYEPRGEEEMKKYEEYIKTAVGFDITRKDQVSIINIPFETNLPGEKIEEEKGTFYEVEKYINYILLFLAVGASMFVLRNLLKRLKSEKILIGQVEGKDDLGLGLTPALPEGLSLDERKDLLERPKKAPKKPVLPDIEEEMSEEALTAQAQNEKIVNYIQKNPAEAARLIKIWLHEDEY